ncbi:MAG: dethiobiotin synthase [Actinomycetota bacterium]|nr:dethiobiotin synthase [Actinomycetota bacterium]
MPLDPAPRDRQGAGVGGVAAVRPARLVVISGTGTEVGKTWVGAALLREGRRRGLRVAARKPLQSFSPGAHSLDSEVLAAASGEPASDVCPEERSFPAPMAPPMAAEALGRPLPTMAAVVSLLEASWPAGSCDLAVVEGAGGVASPLTEDGHTADLAGRLRADVVVLVANPSLGVINSARLAVAALAPARVIVHLNRFDPADDLHRRNAAWLTERDRFEVTSSIAGLVDRLLEP